jgi:hypothetical protein
MSVAAFDLDDIMREVRAAADRAPLAKVANLLNEQPDFSRLAELASPPASEFEARLLQIGSTPCPDGFPPPRWAVILDGADRFARQWAGNAIALGWTFEELFALREPFANVSLQGVAWFMGDKTVTAVTADAITLRNVGEAAQRIYRKSEPR